MPTKTLIEIICDLSNKYQVQPKEVRAIYDKAVKEREKKPLKYMIEYVRKHYQEKEERYSEFEGEN